MYQPQILTEDEGRELLSIARAALGAFVRGEHPAKPAKYSGKFDERYGVFCGLTKNGEPRGRAAVGLQYPLQSLVDATISAVISASHEDKNHEKVMPDELDEIKIELSVLTEPQKIDASTSAKILSGIMPGTDGLAMSFGVYESFLLPQAWKTLEGKEAFLDHLCLQAGIDAEAWRDAEIQLFKFQVQVFGE